MAPTEMITHSEPLGESLPPFLTLRPFSAVPHVVVTPRHKINSLLLHNCSFATIVNRNVSIRRRGCLICDPRGKPSCVGGICGFAESLKEGAVGTVASLCLARGLCRGAWPGGGELGVRSGITLPVSL